MKRFDLRPSPDPALRLIAEKLTSVGRLDADDGIGIFKTADLIGLGRLANAVKEERTGPFVSFVLNRQVNPTNICVLSCKFCDFATKAGDDDAYEMSMADIVRKVSAPIREVHIVGGLHPSWPFEYYEEMLRTIRETNPDAQIKAFTAVELDYFASLAKISIEEVLDRLVAAGLDTLPGGGAEVFSERVRQAMYREKMGEERWLTIHRCAHERGVRTNATLLYGHMETHRERVDHMLKLRDLQDDTQGFMSFIPLAFQPGYTNIVDRQASALEDLKTIAAARLLLDNFPHIKAYWVMLGEETASMALLWGADDLDGTIGEEKIAHAALAGSPQGLTTHRLVKLIREAGRLPVQRDAQYRVIALYPPPGPATHWAQRLGTAQAPVPRHGELAEPEAFDVEDTGAFTWQLTEPAAAGLRRLAIGDCDNALAPPLVGGDRGEAGAGVRSPH